MRNILLYPTLFMAGALVVLLLEGSAPSRTPALAEQAGLPDVREVIAGGDPIGSVIDPKAEYDFADYPVLDGVEDIARDFEPGDMTFGVVAVTTWLLIVPAALEALPAELSLDSVQQGSPPAPAEPAVRALSMERRVWMVTGTSCNQDSTWNFRVTSGYF